MDCEDMPKRRLKPIVGPDGWMSGPPAVPPRAAPTITPFQDPSLKNAPLKPYEQVLKEYIDIRSILQKSQNYKKIIDFAETVLLRNIIKSPKPQEIVDIHNKQDRTITIKRVPSTRGRVNKCICLALGSLSVHPQSMYQLALLEGLTVTFGWRQSESSEKNYTLIAQDPKFNDLDKRLLREIVGCEVVETPTAFDLIDESTFVFAPYMEDKLYTRALRKWPSLTFGNDVDAYGISQRPKPKQVLKVFDEYSKNHMKFSYPGCNRCSLEGFPTSEYLAFVDSTFYYRFSSPGLPVTSPNTSNISTSTNGMPISGTRREGVPSTEGLQTQLVEKRAQELVSDPFTATQQSKEESTCLDEDGQYEHQTEDDEAPTMYCVIYES